MFTEERQNAIEKCLREKGKVRVKELSEMFQVTEDCIRKDLKILENAGRLKRTYGGAILSQEYPLERNVVDRRMYNLDKKKVIAAKAFKLIKNNETIFLDVSTTNIELARLIASSGMHVVAALTTVMVLLGLEVLNYWIPPLGTTTVELNFSAPSRESVKDFIKQIKQKGMEVHSYELKERRLSKEEFLEANIEVKAKKDFHTLEILDLMNDFSDVTISAIK